MALLIASKEGWKVLINKFLKFFLITLVPMIIVFIVGLISDEFPAGWAFAGIIVTNFLLSLAKGFQQLDPDKIDDFEWILPLIYKAIVEFLQKLFEKKIVPTGIDA